MNTNEAIETLTAALTTLGDAGYVVSGELAFIKPATPGLVRSEATFVRGPVPTLTLKTITTREAAPVAVPSTFISGDVCVKCGSGRMQQAGACKVCLDCGESGGCG